jgi:hypothetical protein
VSDSMFVFDRDREIVCVFICVGKVVRMSILGSDQGREGV